jgi:hypothetical protein
MKKHWLILILLTFLSVGFISANAKASLTIATFDDPSGNGNNPLFTVDFIHMTLDGNWPDTKTGLTLEIPYNNNHTFANAWFDVNGVVTLSEIIAGTLYSTGPGEIKFYGDGNSANPLITIEFDSGVLSLDSYSFGAKEFTAENVTITGSEITGPLSQEEFTFNFANVLPPDWSDGFTATAAFTSSAVPEPATICILGLGALSLVRKKRA